MDAEEPSVTARSSQETAEHIAPAFVGRHDPVGDHKGDGTDVVRDHTDGNIIIVFFPVLFVRETAHMVAQRLDRIHIEDRIHILDHGGKTLQSHSCIDVLLFQFTVIAVSVIVKLREDVVPDLHITVTVTAYCTVRLAASVFFASVIIYFRAGTAWTGTVLPEVVFFSELKDPLSRDPHFLVPDLKCLVIIHIHRRIETLRIKPDHIGQELPRPLDRFLFEIIAEGEVSQHLKERTVAGRLSDVLDISRSDTFLTCGHSFPGRDLLPCKVWFQGCHP